MNPAIMPHLTQEHLDGRWFEEAVRASRRRESDSVLADRADVPAVKTSGANRSPGAGCKLVMSPAR